MLLMKPSFEIMNVLEPNWYFKHIELAGRVCYKSRDKITEGSAEKLIKTLIRSGHHSVLEHAVVSVRIVCNRGITHEIVRHRIASYSQESTRYCDYQGGVAFIIPPWVNIETGECKGFDPAQFDKPTSLWLNAMLNAEASYNQLRKLDWKPQQARGVLPIDLKTEIVCTMNLRQWGHFFKLRALGTTGKPHPQMLEIAVPMLKEFQVKFPVFFDDLVVVGEQ